MGTTDFFGRREFREERDDEDELTGFTMQRSGLTTSDPQQYLRKRRQEIKFDDMAFAKLKYLYDTPGVIDDRQVLFFI